MTTRRTFPAADLREILRDPDVYETDEGLVYTFVESEETHDEAAGTDSLGLWNTLVFEVEGDTYRCWYVDGNSYWRSEMGRWEDPFTKAPLYTRDHLERYTLDDEGGVACILVVKREIVAYEWVDADDE